MKNRSKLLLITSLVTMFSQMSAAAEGGNSGGGGNAVLCYKSAEARDNVAKSIQRNGRALLAGDLQLGQLARKPIMADVFEVGVSRGMMNKSSIQFFNHTPEDLYKAIRKLDPQFYNKFARYKTSENQWRGYDSGVMRIVDANYIGNFPRNCLIVQVAYFDDRNALISYDDRIVSLMNQGQRTALRLHEELYSMYRAEAKQYNEIQSTGRTCSFTVGQIYPWLSDSVRPLVGYLMTHRQINSKEFKSFASRIAVSLEEHKDGFWSNEVCRTQYRKIIVDRYGRYGNKEPLGAGNIFDKLNAYEAQMNTN